LTVIISTIRIVTSAAISHSIIALIIIIRTGFIARSVFIVISAGHTSTHYSKHGNRNHQEDGCGEGELEGKGLLHELLVEGGNISE